MEHEDECRIEHFIARYLEFCHETGLSIVGAGLRAVEAGPWMRKAFVSGNRDHSLALGYVHELPKPAPSRFLPRKTNV